MQRNFDGRTFTIVITHVETGLTVKIRPDLLVVTPRLGRKVLVDFKTTSCRNYAQFVATIEQYDYDRQAAFYTDVLQADRFLIIGVQKKAPHGTGGLPIFGAMGQAQITLCCWKRRPKPTKAPVPPGQRAPLTAFP
ncbi:PD-(D/E)XK nuclease-like domain-containing protein [Hymenobacter canadensis]|uniref:PD-(D/E)XK nuclease-like domain-containing protein n=1 Tax=Hymenobacter canadensis TaxID=2999067 RepID=A0ABY7LXB0_9BACT|nr:PD-(D/E)XK nuclease-like domain-containing protein [Hymenobacter canadensis]WBA44229.1 PD-(D/E)XK nuclease-like domain-containing protein [Hymenobacter canadensis]